MRSGKLQGGPVSDLFSKFDDADRNSARRCSSTGLTDPFNLVMERVESPTVAICNGKRTILLGTYNYMGMTFDPDVVAAGKKALDEFGSGTTGSRVLNGTYSGPQGGRGRRSATSTPWTMPWSFRPATRPTSA